MQVSVIIVAAGSGRRMGSNLNKVYVPLGNHRVLTYSLRSFDSIPEVAELICVCRTTDQELLAECLADAGIKKTVKIVIGGATRQESVNNGLKAMAVSSKFFAIHDGARPFITPQKINTLLQLVQKHGAVIPALPLKDTIKIADDGLVIKTLPREKLIAVQTPQIFKRELAIFFNTNQAVTDDASFLEGHYPVAICEGDRLNIKLTEPADLWFAETIIRKVAQFQW